MKKYFVFTMAFLFAFTFGINAQKTDNQPKPTPTPIQISYEDLLAKLKKGDTNIDYRALRMAYSETKDYSYDGIDGAEKQKIFAALNSKKYKEIIKLTDKVFETNFVEPNSHYAAFIANRELKDEKKSEFHKTVLLGLVDSIMNGKDGKSAKNCFEVITISEEYFVMNYLGFKVSSQSLGKEEGHTFDILMGTDPKTKETVKIYFNIDVVWKAETKMFSGK
jgi:outer membrane protein assembly factor BamD (BamD/ComL family)